MGWEIDTKLISDTTFEIEMYRKNRATNTYHKKYFLSFLNKIGTVLNEWTGNTYIGEPKNKEVEQAFQNFFSAIKNLIIFFDSIAPQLSRKEKCFVTSIKYSDIIYRYLGHNTPSDNAPIEIKYNNIFVSWSKNKASPYFESKLYGDIKRLYCKIPNNDFGIDLERLQRYFNELKVPCSFLKNTEQEVIYPTIKETIYFIEDLTDIINDDETKTV